MIPLQPFLFLPPHTVANKQKRGGGGTTLHKPSAAQQKARLDAKFHSITAGLSSVQASTDGIEPEEVIVFETLGDSIEGFAQAAAKIEGMEWVAELELEDVPPVHGFSFSGKPTEPLGCRLYAVFSNQQAMQKLLGLWNDWHKEPKKDARRGYGPFKNLFEHLRDIRRWDVKDRLEDLSIYQDWEVFLESSEETHRFEIELWCRADEESRRKAFQQVKAIIDSAKGQVITQCVRPEILYHGLLVELPKPVLKEVVQAIVEKRSTRLLLSQEVMFFKPHVQAVTLKQKPGAESVEEPLLACSSATTREPVIALFDGLPLENHSAYQGMLVIDDPDNLSAQYHSPTSQLHGTSMASLIVRGDLEVDEDQLARAIYVRPIFVSKDFGNGIVAERLPDNALIVDLVYRAVHRLFEADDSPAKQIKVINFSIGDDRYVFLRQISPLARMLDWLAWKYQVLFIVSAGNQRGQIEIPQREAHTEEKSKLRELALKAIYENRKHRRLYSPAEAINVITVGALHQDNVNANWPDRRIDLLQEFKGTSPIGTVCSGFLRSIKPDVMMPGGRQLYSASPIASDKSIYSIAASTKHPGLKVAAPGNALTALSNAEYSRGTSNATALATRAAAQAYESLLSLNSPEENVIPATVMSCMLRTLLVHSASWPEAESILLRNLFCDQSMHWSKQRSIISQFLGFGQIQPAKASACTEQRATALGWGEISKDQGHVYSFPLPPCLASTKTKRRLTVTLSWFSPINPKHRKYRKALLWFTLADNLIGVKSKETDDKASQRGTVKHQVYEGEQAKVFSDGDSIKIQVNCDSDAGEFEGVVQYALAVSLEVAEGLAVPLYQQVKERIKVPVAPRVAT